MTESPKTPSKSLRPAAIAGGLTVLAVIFAAVFYFTRGDRPSVPRGDERLAPAPEVALDPPADPRPIRIGNIRHTANAIAFTIHQEGPAPVGRNAIDPLLFAVPPDRPLTARVTSYKRGGEPMFSAAEFDAPTTATTTSIAAVKNALRLKDVGILRRWPMASLEIRPEFFTAQRSALAEESGALEAEIELRWDAAFEPVAPAYPAETDPQSPWGRVASRLIENDEGLSLYQLARPPLRPDLAPKITAPWELLEGERRWARLRIADEGIYRLDLDDLISVGFSPAEVKAESIRVFTHGEPVPLLRRGSGAGQQIYFWNDNKRTPYSAERVFWVTLDAALADPTINEIDPDSITGIARMAPKTLRTAEHNPDDELVIQADNLLSIEGMEWVGPEMTLDAPTTFTLETKHYAAPPTPLEANLRFYFSFEEGGVTAPRYELDLLINNQLAGTVLIDGANRGAPIVERKIGVPPELVRDGENLVALTLKPLAVTAPAASAAVPAGVTLFFERMTLKYASEPVPVDGAVALTDEGVMSPSSAWTPLSPEAAQALERSVCLVVDPNETAIGAVRVTQSGTERGIRWPALRGQRVVCVEERAIPRTPRFERVTIDPLDGGQHSADYLVIAHRDFIDIVKPLAQMHEERGLKTRVVDVQSVYDTFSHGELSPEAIRDFLAHTLATWETPPAYVLLVGDCSSDYKNYSRSEVRNWVPTYTYDFRGDKWASDHWFTVLAGQDDLGEFMLGRLSVANRKDAETVVNKILAYANDPNFGPWRARIGYVADDGEFPPVLDEIRTDYTPAAYRGFRTFLDERMPLEDNHYLDREYVERERLKVSAQATANIIEMFRAGMSYLTYYGHGSPNIWMEERVWYGCNSENSDNQHLADSGYMTFITNMTCNTGAIDYPSGEYPRGVNINISEDMMRTRNGGAIALFVPSGPSVTTIHQKMSMQLSTAMFGDKLRRFGELTTAARVRYAAFGHPEQLTYMYVLLGDPAAELHMTKDVRTFSPEPASARPGERVRLRLAGVQPERGRYVVSLATAKEDLIGEEAQGDFTGGVVPIDVTLPKDAPLGNALLRVYAWNAETGKEMAASAEIEIALPAMTVVQASAEPTGENSARVHLIVRNPEAVPLKGAKAEVVSLAHPETALATAEFALAANETTTLTLPIRRASSETLGSEAMARADAYEARLWMNDTAVADRLTTYPLTQRIALLPSDSWAGIVPELSRVETLETNDTIQVHAAVMAGSAATTQWTVGIDDADGTLIKSQGVTVANGRADVALVLRGAEEDRATSGTLWLAGGFAAPGEQPDPAMRFDMASIPRPMSHLRVVPGSIQIDPPDPTDGETIFVKVAIENIGSAPTRNIGAGLHDAPPSKGGRPLFTQIGLARMREQPLAPGERRELTLRWDPFKNAGEQSIWVGVEQGRDPGRSSEDDLNAVAKVRVKTKARLARGETRYVKKEVDGETRHFLQGELVNQGETEARNVVVRFYRSSIATPENRIGPDYLVRVVPPKTTVTAEVEWKPDPERDFLPGVEQPAPYHQLQLKGSARRVVRLATEQNQQNQPAK